MLEREVSEFFKELLWQGDLGEEMTDVNGCEQPFFTIQRSCFKIVQESSVLLVITYFCMHNVAIERSKRGGASMLGVDRVPELVFSQTTY